MKRILIIGGSDAGVSAALSAREVDPIAGITMAVADKYPNYSICGLPYYVSGEVPDWHTLAHRSAEEIEKQGIRILLEHRATEIDLTSKRVKAMDKQGRSRILPYDRLIIATGASPARLSLPGTDLPGVFFLRSLDDALSMKRHIEERRPASAVIMGSGYIGMEMADALTRRGLSTTVLVRAGNVLKTVDHKLQEMVRAELVRNGVKLVDRIDVTGIESQGKGLIVKNAQDVPVQGDMVLLATGIGPETDLARAAGIPVGIHGAIAVNRGMETGLKDIYAAGDCVETWHRLLRRNVYLPLGTTAHKQGRVAGENAAGGKAEFSGSLGTQAVKIFDLVVARTGLRGNEAREAGFDSTTSDTETWDHKAYYPGATPMRVRVTGDRRTRQLLGGQIVGHYRAEVSKRIDVLAAAISAEMTVDGLIDLDLSYTPPVSGPWDPLQVAALEWAAIAGK